VSNAELLVSQQKRTCDRYPCDPSLAAKNLKVSPAPSARSKTINYLVRWEHVFSFSKSAILPSVLLIVPQDRWCHRRSHWRWRGSGRHSGNSSARSALKTQLEGNDEIEASANQVAGRMSAGTRRRNVTMSCRGMQGEVGCGSPPPLRKEYLEHVPIVRHCHHHRANFVSNFLSQKQDLVARNVS
jgi:hypothetical protein